MAFQSLNEIMAEFLDRIARIQDGEVVEPEPTSIERYRDRHPEYDFRIRSLQAQAQAARMLPADLRNLSVSVQLDVHPHLVHVVALEPDVLALLHVAASLSPDHDRWQSYEILKRMGRAYVGWEARLKELRTTTSYEDYIAAMSSLLPIAVEGDVESEEGKDWYE
ncbi:MAG: hypothetical protein ABI324_12920 [Ktedonobacteraceae bacterium]